VMHLCDIAGTAAFFVFISRYVIGFVPKRQETPTRMSYPAWAPTAIPNPLPMKRSVK